MYYANSKIIQAQKLLQSVHNFKLKYKPIHFSLYLSKQQHRSPCIPAKLNRVPKSSNNKNNIY